MMTGERPSKKNIESVNLTRKIGFDVETWFDYSDWAQDSHYKILNFHPIFVEAIFLWILY